MTAWPDPPGGILDGASHLYPLRVFFDDTDAGGVVYHANYLNWFERARSDLVAMLGIDQRSALEAGEGVYAVAEIHIRYFAPARLGDAVVIETEAGHVGRVSCTLRQKARRGGTVLSQATVKVGFIGPDGKPRRQPQAWQDAFASLLASPAQQTLSEGQE